MRFLTALRLGLRRTRHRLGLVWLAYLAALAPALLLAGLVRSNLAGALGKSLAADGVFSGERFAVWMDFLLSRANSLGPVFQGIAPRLLLVLALQTLVTAGLVEGLLGRTAPGQRPFLLGVGRHGWRFLRAAFWMLVACGLFTVLVAVPMGAVRRWAEGAGNGSARFAATLGFAALWLLGMLALKLAYDLSRLAAAAHGEGAMLRGLLRALGYVLKRPAIPVPLLVTFALAGLALHLGYLALRDRWGPAGLGALAALVALQQAILWLRAYLRTGLIASEIAYFQAIGEPRWCARRKKKAARGEKGARGTRVTRVDPAETPADTAPEAAEAMTDPTAPATAAEATGDPAAEPLADAPPSGTPPADDEPEPTW
jgi:hypothetical protein